MTTLRLMRFTRVIPFLVLSVLLVGCVPSSAGSAPSVSFFRGDLWRVSIQDPNVNSQDFEVRVTQPGVVVGSGGSADTEQQLVSTFHLVSIPRFIVEPCGVNHVGRERRNFMLTRMFV